MDIASLTTPFVSDAIYLDGFNKIILPSAVQYKDTFTSIVTGVTPKNGNILGGYNISITGTNLNKATAAITIDGYPCQVFTADATVDTIICLVAKR